MTTDITTNPADGNIYNIDASNYNNIWATANSAWPPYSDNTAAEQTEVAEKTAEIVDFDWSLFDK